MREPVLLPLLAACSLGLVTTSSSLLGAALGLYARISEKGLACVLGFAAGALISAVAIELAFETAQTLHSQGFNAHAAWAFVGGGFALGALIYYRAALFLEGKGAAVRYRTRFREFATQRRREDTQELIQLLSRCDLLRHLPPEQIQDLLPLIGVRYLTAGTVLFREGDPADALYIIARGEVDILDTSDAASHEERRIARLDATQAFGEMALLQGGERTATARVAVDTQLLAIDKADFDHLIKFDPELARAVERLSHSRALSNLSTGGPLAETWAKLAIAGLDRLSRYETDRLLEETGSGVGLAIVFGNILDTIPGAW